KTLKKGSPFAPDSDKPPLRSYQLCKKTFYEETLRESDHMHQTCEKSSLTMTHKLDNMIELPELQSKETYKEDLECKMVMVEMPRCMSWLGSTNAYDERIGSLGMMDNELVTYPKEVEETLGTSMEVEPLDHIKLEDVGLDTCNHDIPISSREVPSFDEPKPQP
ncbi:hypothetical protein Tco_0687069, partial [Tanacetum coccineum]